MVRTNRILKIELKKQTANGYINKIHRKLHHSENTRERFC